MAQNQKSKHSLEAQRRYHAHIDRGNRLSVIAKKCLPALRRRPTASGQQCRSHSDELLADKSLFLRKSRRDLVEVRKAFVFADRRRQLVANDYGYHVDLLPVTKINSKDNKLGGWKTELLF